MTAIGGSCLCGGVKFEITGPLSSPLNCHCSQCRKQHGAPFRSRVRVQVEDFRWLQGEHLIKYYESAGGYLRGFCRECGSPIINRTGPNWKRAAQFPRAMSQYGIALAILDDPPMRPACHVFVGSKAPRFEITASEFFGASQTILIVARAPAQGPGRHRQALHQAMSGHLKRPRDSNELGEFHRRSRSS